MSGSGLRLMYTAQKLMGDPKPELMPTFGKGPLLSLADDIWTVKNKTAKMPPITHAVPYPSN